MSKYPWLTASAVRHLFYAFAMMLWLFFPLLAP